MNARKLIAWLSGVSLVGLALALVACGQFGERTNPVKAAAESGRPELVALALEGSYTIVQGKALELGREPGTSAKVVEVIKRVDAKAEPILDKLRPLAREAEALRAAIAAGETKEERLAIVLRDLNRLVTEVTPLILELTDALQGKVTP